MTARQEIANVLRFYREQEGWTTQDIADKIGISQSNYERIEEAKFAVNIDTLAKIARLYGCKIAVVKMTENPDL